MHKPRSSRRLHIIMPHKLPAHTTFGAMSHGMLLCTGRLASQLCSTYTNPQPFAKPHCAVGWGAGHLVVCMCIALALTPACTPGEPMPMWCVAAFETTEIEPRNCFPNRLPSAWGCVPALHPCCGGGAGMTKPPLSPGPPSPPRNRNCFPNRLPPLWRVCPARHPGRVGSLVVCAAALWWRRQRGARKCGAALVPRTHGSSVAAACCSLCWPRLCLQ